MWIYIIELIFIYIFGYLFLVKFNNKKYFLHSSFILMAIILGLRGTSVGEDTQHFIHIFNLSKNISWLTILSSGTETTYEKIWGVNQNVENGYMILNKMVGSFTSEGQWIVFIVAILTCFLFYRFIYKIIPQHVFIATQVFMCESLYMNTFNLMRQMLAIGIALNAYEYIKDKKYKKALLIFLIAFFFHKSSLVLLILIPLCAVKNNKNTIKYIFIIAILLNMFIPIIEIIISKLVPRYSSYFMTNYWRVNIKGTMVMWVLELIICFIFYKKNNLIKDKDVFIAVSCTIIYLAFDILGLRLSAFSRIALYYRSFLMLLFPLFGCKIQKEYRALYYFGLLSILAVEFISYANIDSRHYLFFWQ